MTDETTPHYWLAYRNCRLISFLRSNGNNVGVIAGDKSCKHQLWLNITKGVPDSFDPKALYFTFMGTLSASDPAIGEMIKKLGPASNRQAVKLKRYGKRKQLIENARNLGMQDFKKILSMKKKGVKHQYIADKYGVSRAFVARLKTLPNREDDLTYCPPCSRSPQATEHGGSHE